MPTPEVAGKSKALNVLIGLGQGLVAGVAGGGVTSGVFIALYHPHGGGDVGDWTFLVVLIFSALIGLPLGAIAGIVCRLWGRPWWHLLVGMSGAGLLAGVVSLFALSHG